MTRTNANQKVAAAATIAQDRAREVAAKVKPAAAQVKPLAKTTQEAARRGIVRTRTWAAPQIERTGQALQDNVAPKVADVLSSAARRIEPEKPRSRNWWTLSGIAVLVAAAATAAAAALRKRSKAASTMPAAEADDLGAEAAPGTPQPSDNADATRAGRTS
jgi:hypothetical protein